MSSILQRRFAVPCVGFAVPCVGLQCRALALRCRALAQLVAGSALEHALVVALGAPLHGVFLQLLRVNLVAIGADRLVGIVLLIARVFVGVLDLALLVFEVGVVGGQLRHVLHGAVAVGILAHGGIDRLLFGLQIDGFGRVAVREIRMNARQRVGVRVAFDAGEVRVFGRLRAVRVCMSASSAAWHTAQSPSMDQSTGWLASGSSFGVRSPAA